MAEPFSHDEELAKQSAQARRQLIIDYKVTFAGDRGERVWNDLSRLFGFEQPSGSAGMSHGDVMLREGMKMPLWYIKKMREMKRPERKSRQRKALSGPTDPSSSTPPGL